MTGKQTAVMWIGLLIVFANLIVKWGSIKNVIFSGANATQPGASGSGGGGGGFTIPKLPWFIPTWPGTSIPLVSKVTPNS